MKKKALGRGLGALIGKTTAPVAAVAGVNEKYRDCPIGDIRPNRRQPRKVFDDLAMTELAESIKENGIIEPLVARKTDDGLELIAGERRWRAGKIAGLTEVPVVIVDATDEQSFELAIVENVQREDLNAVEEAEAYRTLMGFGLTQDEVAKKVGKERATVANYLRLLKLPDEIKAEVAAGVISMGHARAILSVEGHARRRELCRKIIKNGLSVRETEALASKGVGGTGAAKNVQRAAIHIKPLEDELRRAFGTKVVVREKAGRGKVEIEFYSAEERERIIDMLRTVS